MYKFWNVLSTIFHKDTGNIYHSVIQCYLQFPCFGTQSTEFCYQWNCIEATPNADDITFWSEYCILMQYGCFYQLWMWIKIQHSFFKIGNNEENIINLVNLLSLWFILWLLRGIDHKDRRFVRLITFSSLLLILNILCYTLIYIWSW